jgi:hypothetical protein
LKGKKSDVVAVWFPSINNSGERRDVLVFLGVGVGNFSRAEWPQMNITGMRGAAGF